MSSTHEAERRPPRAFHVLAKPIGPICNLRCTYCFYTPKEALYPNEASWRMSDSLLESFIRQYVEAQDVPVISFTWQGGEPTLLGVDFFQKAVALQKKFSNGKRIENALQTNGMLLDDNWCEFLVENEFLVGLSIDGSRELHDSCRRRADGGSTFEAVLHGLQVLKRHGVQFNTLTTVNRANAESPLEVYRFLKDAGSVFMQFIPVVEQEKDSTNVSPISVSPLQWGKFLCEVFDEWVRLDVGQTFVQMFDEALAAWYGRTSSLCIFSESCGQALALEHNGDLYSCDHFVSPAYLIGNIHDRPLSALADSDGQARFGKQKASLPIQCLECKFKFACNGECPKNRFLLTEDGPKLNYLCAGYKIFFRHIDPYMRFMAQQLAQQRPAANVMHWTHQRDFSATTLGRNDPCICGSGRKFKRCCGLSS